MCVCAQAQGGASARDVLVCVGRCVLLGGVGACLRRSCWGAVPSLRPPLIYTPARAGGERLAPLLASPTSGGDFPGLAGEAGVGSCKGVWQLLNLALLCCVTLSRCLLLAEPRSFLSFVKRD